MTEQKWNYKVLTCKDEKPDDDYIQSQVEANRFFMAKSNMYCNFTDILPYSLIELLEVNGIGEEDEIMLWDEWEMLKDCHDITDVLMKDEKTFAELIDFLHESRAVQ